jgi:hypothetical protein
MAIDASNIKIDRDWMARIDGDSILHFLAKDVSDKFNVGDIVVIRPTRDYPELLDHYADRQDIIFSREYSEHDPTPHKYYVADKSQLGFAILIRITTRNTLEQQSIFHILDFMSKGYVPIIDPEYLEAIMFGNESAYDPMAKKREMLAQRAEILKYNASIRLPTMSKKDTLATLKSLKAGQVYWTSNAKFFTVLKEIPDRLQVEVKLSSGQEKTLYVGNLNNKLLYTAQPKKYKSDMK